MSGGNTVVAKDVTQFVDSIASGTKNKLNPAFSRESTMAFPSKETKLISGSAFKACERGLYYATRPGQPRENIDSLAVRLAFVLAVPCLSGV